MNRHKPKHGTRPFIIFTILATLLPYSAMAQQDFGIDACISYALDHNKDVQNAVFDQYIAKAQVKEFAATGFPQVSLGADLQYFVELPTQILPGFFAPEQDIVIIDGKPYPLTRLDPETFQPIPGQAINAQFGFPWQSTVGANLNWTAIDGAYFYGVKAAKEYAELTQRQANRTREEVVLAVSKAYIQAFITREQANLLLVNISRIEKLLTETKALNTEGFVEAIDVDRLQINFNNLQLEKAKIERYVLLADALLKFQMGMPLEDSLSLLAPESSPQSSPALPDNISQQYNPEQDLDLAILRKTEDLQKLDLKRTQMGYLPKISLFGSYQVNAQRDAFNFLDSDQQWFPISVVGLQMNWNVFDSFMKVRKIEQQRIGLDKLQNQQEQLIQASTLEYEQAKMELLNAYSTLESTRANVELANRIFNVATIKYREGVGSSLELNDANTGLREAENANLKAFYDYLQAELSFEKAMGSFSQYHSFRN
ncbi:MAG: TolC family protein [Bacteroidia bacterium]|nr:TolC family protein [Bacteroidia bacterium]